VNPDAMAAFVFAIFGLAGGMASVLLGWLLFRVLHACFSRPEGQ
jgi:hypothetical protein